jgi:dipicolinate synthase subunit B
MKELGAEIYPVFSYTVDQTDNRFYNADDLKEMIRDISDKPIINSIVGAEPIGPGQLLDIVVVIPATGNTIAKLANGIVDTPALMAVKAHLRNQRPVVIGISTNDALSINARNIGLLLNMKNIYFIPFRQDSPHTKANSVIAAMDYICETVIWALKGKQMQPLLLGPA